MNASDPLLYCITVFPSSCLYLFLKVSLFFAPEYRITTYIMAAVTRQLHTLVYVLFFFLPLLRQPILYSSCASRARHPCIQFSIPTSLLQLSHSFNPRTSSVGTICVFTVSSPPSSLLRALYRIPIFSAHSDSVNLCNVFALPYLISRTHCPYFFISGTSTVVAALHNPRDGINRAPRSRPRPCR